MTERTFRTQALTQELELQLARAATKTYSRGSSFHMNLAATV
jgi:hypothetical protein